MKQVDLRSVEGDLLFLCAKKGRLAFKEIIFAIEHSKLDKSKFLQFQSHGCKMGKLWKREVLG
ncbi:hypothetical protein J2736_002391 [Paenibacillus qinlingensis]|uniref:Uncharacterized protein n=1 Tax=Paenibacillus qinlingensis TaxID=1837343 RepID=A0ABU1NUR0_9BACL|nr:hypothetical protein [Paenibacillus qinlingensis]